MPATASTDHPPLPLRLLLLHARADRHHAFALQQALAMQPCAPHLRVVSLNRHTSGLGIERAMIELALVKVDAVVFLLSPRYFAEHPDWAQQLTLAQRSERMRAVEGFLRRRVASSLPVAFDMNEQSGVPMRFVGEGDRIRFVADLPNYLGRGGPYLHDVQVVDGARGGLRLQVGFSMVMTNEVIEESDARPPETLADGLREVRFRYRSLTPENRIGEWEDRWQYADRLPLQVAIDIVDDRGDAWPRIVVALPQAASYGGAFAQPTL